MAVNQQQVCGVHLPLVYLCSKCVYCPSSHVLAARSSAPAAQPTPQKPFPLMKLPAELRERILHYVLKDIYPSGGINICGRGVFNGNGSFQPFKKRFVWQSYDGAIFRVSRTIALEMQDAVARYLPLRYSLNPRFDAFFHSAFTPLDARDFFPALARMRNLVLNFPVNCNIDLDAHVQLERFFGGLAGAKAEEGQVTRVTVMFEELWFANAQVLAEAIAARMESIRLCLAALNKLLTRPGAILQLRYKFGPSWTAESRTEIEHLLIGMGGRVGE